MHSITWIILQNPLFFDEDANLNLFKGTIAYKYNYFFLRKKFCKLLVIWRRKNSVKGLSNSGVKHFWDPEKTQLRGFRILELTILGL